MIIINLPFVILLLSLLIVNYNDDIKNIILSMSKCCHK